MIDTNFKVWLIEVNTNPCLALSSPLLGELIPEMLDNAFAIAIDGLYPPDRNMQPFVNKFELVFTDSLEPISNESAGESDGESSASDEAN